MELRRSQRNKLAIDRLTTLPDVLLSHILSLLPIKEAAATSILSTKWKHTWTTVTKLHLDDSLTYTKRTRNKKTEFMAFANKLLSLSLPIEDFHLESTYKYTTSEVYPWISGALRLKPRNIHIRCSSTGSLVIPDSLYDCRFLVELYLFIMFSTLKIPTSFSLSNLRILQLFGIRILNEDLSNSGKVNFCLPVLEVLALRYIDFENTKVVNIDAPKLNKFSMQKVDNLIVKMNEHGLTEFEFSNCSFVDFIELSMPLVTHATIEFFDLEPQPVKMALLTCTLLRQLPSLKYLIMSPQAIQAMEELKDLQDYLPTFTNLIHLTMTSGIPVTVGMVITLLKNSPVLETFIFDYNFCFQDNIEVVQVAPLCSHHHLKVVQFMDFHWTELEVELAKCLLKNAMTLEGMTIITSKGQLNPEKSALKELILSFPRSSDCASILFKR